MEEESTVVIWDDFEGKGILSWVGTARVAGSDKMLANDIGSFALTGLCFKKRQCTLFGQGLELLYLLRRWLRRLCNICHVPHIDSIQHLIVHSRIVFLFR